ncbi:MAG TPA: MBL fold metallo-hydrolase [Myxococcota bacterium]|nr:MBL fold metallo-hydrolase [Myxococcota bacterium]
MNLHFIGHACFLISSADGTRLLIDPFQPRAFNGRIRLEPHSGPVDAVISTHSHLDHRHIGPSFGSPLVFEGPGQIHGIDIDCIKLPHGAPEGKDHGLVRAFRINVDGISIVHLGDAGRIPSDAEMQALGRPDILLLPIGGRFSLDPIQAAQLVRSWRPAFAVPMHYQDPLVDITLRPLSEFTDQFDGFVTVSGDFTINAVDRGRPPIILVIRRA